MGSKVRRGELRGERNRQAIYWLMYFGRWKCYQCRRLCVTQENVTKRRKVVVNPNHVGNNGYIEWLTPWGAVARCQLATIEHKRSLGQGGDSHWTNLRLLCYRCNQQNNHANMRYERSLQKRSEKSRQSQH